MSPRIVGVEATPVRVPLHTPFVTALRRTTTVDSLVIRLTDDDGHVGWGESPQVWQVTGESVASALACLQQMLAPVVLGRGLDDWVDVIDGVHRAVARNLGVKAALDTAVHDLVARSRGRSVSGLLGASDRGPTVATDVTLSATSAGLADAARHAVGLGFTTLKMKVGGDPQDVSADVDRVRVVRREVGEDITIRLDANQAWSRDRALEAVLGLARADLDVEFVEQPLRADDVEGHAWLRARSPLAIMLDESVYGAADLERVIATGAADHVNIKLAKCGGLGVGVGMLRRAEDAGLGTIVGSMMETHVGLAAAASLVAAAGTSLTSDLDAAWWCAESAYRGGPHYGAGSVEVGAGPGLGVTGWADNASLRADPWLIWQEGQ